MLGFLLSIHPTNSTTFQQARLYQADGVPFQHCIRKSKKLNCYNQSINSDVLSRSSQTIWNARYPLWPGHHIREQEDLEIVVTRRTVVIGGSWPCCTYGSCDKNSWWQPKGKVDTGRERERKRGEGESRKRANTHTKDSDEDLIVRFPSSIVRR